MMITIPHAASLRDIRRLYITGRSGKMYADRCAAPCSGRFSTSAEAYDDLRRRFGARRSLAARAARASRQRLVDEFNDMNMARLGLPRRRRQPPRHIGVLMRPPATLNMSDEKPRHAAGDSHSL